MKRRGPATHRGAKIGRPLSFDRDEALRAAMLEFWRHGYDGASIASLTAAMGITPPSLYSAFGSKDELFAQSVQLYLGEPHDLDRVLAGAASAKEAVKEMLRASAENFTDHETPLGCLLASAATSGAEASAPAREAVARARAQVRESVRKRIVADVNGGLLPADTDASALADLALATTQGMSVFAREGASLRRLNALIEAAMAAWP